MGMRYLYSILRGSEDIADDLRLSGFGNLVSIGSAKCTSFNTRFIVSDARFSKEQKATSIAGTCAFIVTPSESEISTSLEGRIPFETANCTARPAAMA